MGAIGSWYFHPWNLGSDVLLRGVRLLVVAESHYREADHPGDFTQFETANVVQRHAPGYSSSGGTKFFRTIADLLADDETPSHAIWKSIYFYNYFQAPMETASTAPSRQNFKEGVAPFDDVLEAICPDAVIVVSSRLWHGMENAARFVAKAPEYGSIYAFAGRGSLSVPATYTWHPSARRRYDLPFWTRRVRAFLEALPRLRSL